MDWLHATAAQLQEYVDSCDIAFGRTEEGYGHSDDFNWRYEEKYPLDALVAPYLSPSLSKNEVIAWYQQEKKRSAQEGFPDRFDELETLSLYHEPIVVIEKNGRHFIWDGSHRVGAALYVGKTTINAVVGRTKNKNPQKEDSQMYQQTIWDAFRVGLPGRASVEYQPIGANPQPGQRRVAGAVQHWGVAWGAQIFVGLNVEDHATGQSIEKWRPEQVRDAVKRIRIAQLFQWAKHAGLSPNEIASKEYGASIVPQFGMWGKLGASGARERSVSVNILSLSGEDTTVINGQATGTFVEHIGALMQQLGVEFEQDSVIAQIHEGGIVRDTLNVSTTFE